MKRPVEEPVLPQTLEECHALIQQLAAHWDTWPTREAEWTAQHRVLTQWVARLEHEVARQTAEARRPIR